MSKPRAIYPLNPGRIRVKLDKTTFPYKLSHYEFTIDNKVFRFEPYQILHIKYPDPGDPYVGIGIPQTIPSWIDSDNCAMEYNRKFFINGATRRQYEKYPRIPKSILMAEFVPDGYISIREASNQRQPRPRSRSRRNRH